jgi:hypothetical protein
VVDIGTEWSMGICTISTGRIEFMPRIGIVGDRTIDVLEVLDHDSGALTSPDLEFGSSITYVVRTAAGDLYWTLPDRIAADASALLFTVRLKRGGRG